MCADYVKAVSASKIKLVKGEITGFTPTAVTVSNGRTVEADVVVLATGVCVCVCVCVFV